MKMVTEYLAQAAQFERMADEEQNPTFKEQLLSRPPPIESWPLNTPKN